MVQNTEGSPNLGKGTRRGGGGVWQAFSRELACKSPAATRARAPDDRLTALAPNLAPNRPRRLRLWRQIVPGGYGSGAKSKAKSSPAATWHCASDGVRGSSTPRSLSHRRRGTVAVTTRSAAARLGAAMLASSAAASMLTRDAGCACSSSASTSSTDSRRKDSPYEPQSRWIHFRRTAVALAAGGSRGGTPAPAQASTCHPNERPWTR